MTREEQERYIVAKALKVSDVVHKLRKVLEKSDLSGRDEMHALGMLVAFKVRLYGHQEGLSEEKVLEAFLSSCSHLLTQFKFQIVIEETKKS
jgi:predicted DNA-binding protein with PD1-like motif